MSKNILAYETAAEMLARLSLVTLEPKRILNASYSDEEFFLLKTRYPNADIVTVNDLTEKLSLADDSIDLLFANLVLPWCEKTEWVLREWQRVLRPDGLLMLTSLGLDTLAEIKERDTILLPKLIDMHNIGDLLARVGFADPVLDVDYFTLTYREHQRLCEELHAMRMISASEMIGSLEKNNNGVFPLTYEVIYVHAWGAETRMGYQPDETGTVNIPLESLRRRGL
jgi:malonyl-CoA O-methyltransferase